MTPWLQSHIVLTAATIPVALLVWWLVNKRTASETTENDKEKKTASSKRLHENTDDNHHLSNGEVSVKNIEMSVEYNVKNTEKTQTLADEVISTENQSANEYAEDLKLHTNANVSISNVGSETLHNSKLVKESAVNQSVSYPLQENLKSPDVPGESDETLDQSHSHKEKTTNNNMEHNISLDSVTAQSSEDMVKNPEIDEQPSHALCEDSADLTEHPPTGDLPSSIDSSNDSDAISSSIFSTEKGSLTGQSEGESAEIDVDTNTNNNNSRDHHVKMTNGQTNAEEHFYHSTCKSSNKYCTSFGDNQVKACKVIKNVQNGWNHDDTPPITNGEFVQDEKKNFKKRTDSISTLEFDSGSDESKMQVYVEFPSDKVGLLIGKQGRNIKQLKQDSGADVYVHAAKFRDDIQVLQICGTQVEVESCVSRIKRRFHDITLSPFDPANICSPAMSPSTTTPPPVIFPPITQVHLPDGMPVDVVVTAIAAVDCIFVQSYTHPSYPGLAGLQRAMAMCYAEPSTPGLPKPIQSGLICAAPQQKTWYRAQVLQHFDDTQEVLIKFMDYGGYSTISDKSIKQIRADFVNLPFQAVECYLDNVAPLECNDVSNNDSSGDHQNDEAVAKVAAMMNGGNFQAHVTGYTTTGHPKINLFKFYNNTNTLINREVVSKGFATWTESTSNH